jgi:Tol biopolymer transport system component
MGTVGYMSPEQVRGQAADHRADIFAFGAILYEMLTGKRAFQKPTSPETMTAILNEDPPGISQVTTDIPLALQRVVHRCLEKNPEQRFQSARDLSFALGALSGTEASAVGRAAAAIPRRVPLLLWSSIALALVAVAVVTWFVARRPEPTSRMQFAIPVPEEMSVSHLAISRDGSMLAFVSPDEKTAAPMLYVQRIGSPNVTLMPGTQGATYPFWSPDGAYIAFFAGGKLLKMSIAGGTPQTVTNVLAARGGSWGSRGVIVYAPGPSSGIWRVNPDGSGAAPVTQELLANSKDQVTHRWPIFLPDGKQFLFWAGNFANPKDDRVSGIYVSSIDDKGQKLVLLCRSSVGYDSQHLFYADDNRQLVSVPFDTSAARILGSATAIANLINFQPSTYWAAFSVAWNGTVVYNTGAGGSLSALTWMDRSGKELGRVGDVGVIANPNLSPDDSRVAVDITDVKANNVDIWLQSAGVFGAAARFTFDPEEEASAVWSRDGSMLAYRSSLGRGASIFVKRANGLERETSIGQAPTWEDSVPNSWTPDGQGILCTDFAPTDLHLEMWPITGGSPTRFLSSKSNQSNGQISRDGKWLAYASDESGIWEIYVTSFPAAAGKWQVSRGGGTEPRWRGDGKEIFYIGPTGMLMAVPVSGENGFSTGTPAPLFQIGGRAPISSTDIFTYDVAKDGKRFLVNRYVKPEHVPPLTILLNAATANSSF